MFQVFKSLRFRLSALFVMIVGGIVVALAVTGLTLRERYLRTDFDNRLRYRYESITASLLSSPQHSAADLARLIRQETRGLYFREFYVQIRDPEGNPLERSDNLGAYMLPFDKDRADIATLTRPVSDTLTGEEVQTLLGRGGQLRMMTALIPNTDGDPFYLQVATSTDHLDIQIASQRRIFAMGIPLGLLAASVAAWLVTGSAMRRLVSAAEMMKHVTPQEWGTRLNVQESEDEIGMMVHSLNEMLERLERAFQAQQRFIANASHELKTPVSVLLSESQVIQRSNPDAQAHMTFARSVEQEMRRLGDMIESLLTLVRVEGKQNVEFDVVVSLNDVLLTAVHDGQQLAKEQDVQVRLRLPELSDDATPDAQVHGNAGLLESMVSNLIRNAVKFTTPGGHVDVEMAVDQEHATIHVADEGPGIQQEYLEKIFDRYVQVPDRNAAHRGTGLGLSIAKRVCELHNGQISVTNRRPRGCVFHIKLPLSHLQSPDSD